MTTTTHLSLPYLESGQAQKHVTLNESLRMLDALVMPAVKDRDLAAPPAAPADGDRYIVGAPGSGAFAGKDNQIAQYVDGGWLFHPPRAGWTCYVEDESVLAAFDGAGWIAASGAAGGREVLAANRTYYVRTDGSDSNDGLANTAGGAFLTIQKAVDVIVGMLDLGGFSVTIQLGDGTYAAGGSFSAPWSDGGKVTIQGNSGTPANVIVGVTGSSCLHNTGVLPGVLTIKDMELRVASSGIGIRNEGIGTINYSNIRFGACATAHVYSNIKSAKVVATGNYAIVGNSPYHLLCLRGEIDISGRTVTLTGTPAFSAAFAAAFRLGYVGAEANTFSGSATGPRYNVNTNALIYTGGAGATYFPGDSAGASASGGQYF